ncbi:hypothetical protein TNCV_4103061 [Trichonephila clavipes]|nr:hypothetical protein TNCV_4103061 [Trichonephila clavipes]
MSELNSRKIVTYLECELIEKFRRVSALRFSTAYRTSTRDDRHGASFSWHRSIETSSANDASSVKNGYRSGTLLKRISLCILIVMCVSLETEENELGMLAFDIVIRFQHFV